MDILFLLLRLVAFGSFATAAVAKWLTPGRTQEAVRQFGIPGSAVTFVARLVPLVEAAVAAGVLLGVTVRPAALVAVVLLTLFSIAIARALAGGRQVECNCFGPASRSVGWGSVARNTGLTAVVAAVAIGAPERGVVSSVGALTTVDLLICADVTLAVAVLALAWFALQLLRQQGRLLLRLDGIESRGAGTHSSGSATTQAALPLGVKAPSFTLTDLAGASVRLGDLLLAGRPRMLVFASPQCGPCTSLVPDLSRWAEELAGTLDITLISGDSTERSRTSFASVGLERVLLDPDTAVSRAYAAYGTPSAVVISHHGTVASSMAQGREQITALVRAHFNRTKAQTIRELPPTEAPPVPEGAPEWAEPR